MSSTLFELARRVEAGVRFLDRRVPDWRRILQRHADDFDIGDGNHCVLGTLEHYNGLRRIAAKKRLNSDYNDFGRALARFGFKDGMELGFDFIEGLDVTLGEQRRILNDLWRAQFEATSTTRKKVG